MSRLNNDEDVLVYVAHACSIREANVYLRAWMQSMLGMFIEGKNSVGDERIQGRIVLMID